MRWFAYFAALVLPAGAHAVLIKRCQQPAPSPDGSVIAFSWQGDIWRVASTGGRAERLTIHPAADTYPIFTPDGSRIVFSSARYGSTDLFSMKADGTDLKRITFETSSEVPTSISPDGKYVFGHTNAFGRTDLFKVPITGGDLVRLTGHPLEVEYNPSVSLDGTKVYYNRGSYGPTSWRKPGVHSSALSDIWVADNTVPLSNHRVAMRSENHELSPQQVPGGDLLYMSNADGWPNLYLGKKKLTAHSFGTVRYPRLSGNGKTVAYEFNSEIWTYDLASGQDKKLAIEVPDDQRDNPTAVLNLTEGVDGYAVAPDGKRSVIQVRGELFLIPEKGGTTRRLTDSPAWDGQPTWLDAKTILYAAANSVSKRELKTVNVDGDSKPFLSGPEDLTHPTISPDGKWVAFHSGVTEIAVVPAAGGERKLTITGNYNGILDGQPAFSWSPDSRYLAVSQPTDRGTNVMLMPLDGGKSYRVAQMSRDAGTPKFLPNGRGVYFTAVWEEENELFLVDLVPDDLSFSEDDLDKIDSAKPAGDGKVEVRVQEWGIERRLRKLTSLTNAFDAIAAPDSRSLYVTAGSPLALYTVRTSGGAPAPVAGAPALLGFGSGPGGKLYGVSLGKLMSLGAAGVAPISFSASWELNLRAEEQALFNEIWWAMDRMYYDPAHNGKDWPAIRAKFAQVVPYCYDRTDFYALMGDMMEELDSSHLGSNAPGGPGAGIAGGDSTGFLGIELDPNALDARQAYVISKVIPGSPADDPSSNLKKGDQILSVDGVKPGPSQTLATLLNRKTGKKVRLSIQRDGKSVEVLIKPSSRAMLSGLQYEDWVNTQRELVEKLSGGKLTYFHIQGMDDVSFQRFLREIRIYAPGKKGAVVDVRFNGGGSTSHKVLGIMIKTNWLVRTTRGPQGIHLSENIFRGDSLEIPTALMMNQASYSNAEIMGEGFRRLIKGPIVGERTPGYVIGTGAYGLWDGGSIRMPSIGCYAIDGENLENNGRKPDFLVWFDPNADMEGRDTQTEKAVQELLKKIG